MKNPALEALQKECSNVKQDQLKQKGIDSDVIANIKELTQLFTDDKALTKPDTETKAKRICQKLQNEQEDLQKVSPSFASKVKTFATGGSPSASSANTAQYKQQNVQGSHSGTQNTGNYPSSNKNKPPQGKQPR